MEIDIMYELKTKLNDGSVLDFLKTIQDEKKGMIR